MMMRIIGIPGRGPLDARTFFVNAVILIRLRSVLTPAEQKLAEDREGQRLVKETRRKLFEPAWPFLAALVNEILTCRLFSRHSDLSTRTGKRVIVLTWTSNSGNLNKNPMALYLILVNSTPTLLTT